MRANRTQKVQTTNDVFSQATASLDRDIERLGTKRHMALNSFRETARDLAEVSDSLREKVTKLDELESFINSQRSAANQMISDNDAVRQRILEIIGE